MSPRIDCSEMVDLAIAALEAGEELPSFSSLAAEIKVRTSVATSYFGNSYKFMDAVDAKLRQSGRKLLPGKRTKTTIVSAEEDLFEKVKKILGNGGPYDDRIEAARRLIFGQCQRCQFAAASDQRFCPSHLFYGAR